MEGKRKFCICKKFRASKMAFLARFCLKNNWHFGQIWLISLRNAHFLVLWKHSSQSYGHFGTFTTKNGKLTISPQSPILTQISLLGLWTWHFRSYLSNKTLTTFLQFLVLELQPNFPVTQLSCPLCAHTLLHNSETK